MRKTNAQLIAEVNALTAKVSELTVQVEAFKAKVAPVKTKASKVAPTIVAAQYAPQRGKTTRKTWLATMFDLRGAYGYREAACRRAAQLGSTDTFAVKSGPKGTFSIIRYEH
jgi:outer membrane murein-binding lipoprotein Lpp